MTSRVLQNYFEGTLGDTLGVDWGHFEGTLGSFWRYALDYFGGVWGQIEGHLGVLQVIPWGDSGSTLG